ncbi:hypothetical protein Tco_1482258 [Tanacetum coccineum]
MNPQESQQVVARDEKWVPSTERVKISSTNVRLETTMQQKEETFQVVIDVIKHSTCFKAFTITAEVPEVFMQHFWYTIKKVKDSESYEFLLANKKCIVDAEVFRKIMDICLRVEGEEFTLKSRGKGSQGKKTIDTPVVDVDVSKESKPKPAKKRRTTSRRVVKKKDTISTADNIIPDPDVSLELGKSISLTEAAEEEAAKQVHAMHVRIVTESVPKPAKNKTASRSTGSVVIQETPSAPKSKLATLKLKLKGIPSLTHEEQLVANIKQALKESKKPSRRQLGTRGSSEGTGFIPGVLDESTVVSSISSEGIENQGDDEEVNWIDSDDDDEVKKDDTDNDKSKEQVNDDEDKDMSNVKVEESGNDDEEDTDTTKVDSEKTEDAKDDSKKAELPLTSSSLSVSSGFGDQFLKVFFDTYLIGTVKNTTDVEINSLLDIKIQSEVPHIKSPSVLKVSVSVISEPSVLTPVQESPSVAPVTTLPPLSVSTIPPIPHQTTTPIPTPPISTESPTITTAVPKSDALTVVQLRVAKLEKDVSELKNINLSIEALANLKSQPAPESRKIQTLTVSLEQEFEKSALEILKIKREQAEKQKISKYTIKSTDKATLKEYDQKSALY